MVKTWKIVLFGIYISFLFSYDGNCWCQGTASIMIYRYMKTQWKQVFAAQSLESHSYGVQITVMHSYGKDILIHSMVN